MNGSQMIAAERKRQRTKEKWSYKHDYQEHGDGQLVDDGIGGTFYLPTPDIDRPISALLTIRTTLKGGGE